MCTEHQGDQSYFIVQGNTLENSFWLYFVLFFTQLTSRLHVHTQKMDLNVVTGFRLLRWIIFVNV